MTVEQPGDHPTHQCEPCADAGREAVAVALAHGTYDDGGTYMCALHAAAFPQERITWHPLI